MTTDEKEHALPPLGQAIHEATERPFAESRDDLQTLIDRMQAILAD